VAELERTQQEPDDDDSDLVQALELQTAAADLPRRQPSAAQESPQRKQANGETPFSSRGSEEPGVQGRRAETIRVAVGTLERLMLLVSELVLTRNQLLELTKQGEETIKAPLQRLSGVTSDLQDAVMLARMQPVGRLFSTLPRLVPGLSVEVGKKIHLVTEGAETELDRQLIELIRDPLTHMIGNCAAHGIERPGERLAAGKPEGGRSASAPRMRRARSRSTSPTRAAVSTFRAFASKRLRSDWPEKPKLPPEQRRCLPLHLRARLFDGRRGDEPF
jgi:two-component system, chemotaxis family, sensor kinase CheA